MHLKKQQLFQTILGAGLASLISACSMAGPPAGGEVKGPEADQGTDEPLAAATHTAVPDATFTSAGPVETDLPTSTAYPTVNATAKPIPPNGVAAAAAAAFDVTLTWKDNSSDEDGFHVYRDDLEVQGGEELIGTTAFDATTFVDTSAACGGVYKYTLASYNMLGEGKAPVCWVVRMQECSAPKTLTIQGGIENGANFATGNAGADGDLYLTSANLMADQAGQLGVIDLGETGSTPLDQVSVPTDAAWSQAGVALVQGHTYAVALRDGRSIAIFTVKSVSGDTAEVEYIVYSPRDVMDFSGCNTAQDVLFCSETGPNVFTYYTVRITYDANGNVVSQEQVGPATTGGWVPGCPPAAPTQPPPPNPDPTQACQRVFCAGNFELNMATCQCFCPLTAADCPDGIYSDCTCVQVPK